VLKALIISSDMQLVWAVEPVLRKLEFDVNLKPTMAEGSECLRYSRYNALLVDFARAHSSEMQELRKSEMNRATPLIAIAERSGRKAEMLAEAGADTVWARPVFPDRVHRDMMSVRAKAVGDRRLQRRLTLGRSVLLRYSYDGRQYFQAGILDITETGVAIDTMETLPAGRHVQIQFSLPAMQSGIEAVAHVVWRCENGRAGLTFLQMAEEQRRRLDRWLDCYRRGMSTGHLYAAS
jgi:hypothetical protein